MILFYKYVQRGSENRPFEIQTLPDFRSTIYVLCNVIRGPLTYSNTLILLSGVIFTPFLNLQSVVTELLPSELLALTIYTGF